MPKPVAPALKELLKHFIDYAGIFPPAALSFDQTIANFSAYQTGQYRWMLRSLVISAADMPNVPEALDGCLAVLGIADDERAASIETRSIVIAKRPVYCEVAVDGLPQLDEVKQSNCFAKIRTGGLKSEAIPTSQQVAAFICACADRRLAFKATAGLHHPLRGEYALTYEANAPRAVMHGFINVLMAAAFAWHGERQLEPILSEADADAFRFDDRAHWRNKSLDAAEVRQARLSFMHSVGSCSFDEPVHELQALGLL